jgi:wyosine [tRNA(Phe)-imidazoG37] synthetase (radical SAM superfamily)
MLTAAEPTAQSANPAVYGPVTSWRFGASLGIDPIGAVSTCSFNCVYCQLGEIQRASSQRQVFVATEQIRRELIALTPCPIDTVTLSGSGEPTLAANLAEIVVAAQQIVGKPVGVLTNGSLLTDPAVCQDLALADWVAVKLDAISADQFRRINRPVRLDLQHHWAGLRQFRQIYRGHLAIQTMLLAPWSEQEQADYIAWMVELMPDEIQLNTPRRPRSLTQQLDARANHACCPYPAQALKPVSSEVLQKFADRIETVAGIPVRCAG